MMRGSIDPEKDEADPPRFAAGRSAHRGLELRREYKVHLERQIVVESKDNDIRARIEGARPTMPMRTRWRNSPAARGTNKMFFLGGYARLTLQALSGARLADLRHWHEDRFPARRFDDIEAHVNALSTRRWKAFRSPNRCPRQPRSADAGRWRAAAQ